jgi:hypothetical protein
MSGGSAPHAMVVSSPSRQMGRQTAPGAFLDRVFR